MCSFFVFPTHHLWRVLAVASECPKSERAPSHQGFVYEWLQNIFCFLLFYLHVYFLENFWDTMESRHTFVCSFSVEVVAYFFFVYVVFFYLWESLWWVSSSSCTLSHSLCIQHKDLCTYHVSSKSVNMLKWREEIPEQKSIFSAVWHCFLWL